MRGGFFMGTFYNKQTALSYSFRVEEINMFHFQISKSQIYLYIP